MHPYQRNQVPCAPLYYPTVPPHMKMEPARSPATYEPRPWDGSYGYSYPVQCHGCCNHNYFPGHFMSRPQYPHIPPPSCHGYPAAPGGYPVQYFHPSLHYTMELPCYEYNKDMPIEHHCCGCPNHQCNQKEGKTVKQEEEPGQVEIKGNESLVPYEFKNYPYPIVWLPPSYAKAKEQKSSDDSDYKGWDRSSRGSNVHENSKFSEEQPTSWNGGWFPFDANNLRSSKQGEDHKRSQHNQDDKQSRFPFPIFWMPYKPEVTEREEPKEMVIKQGPQSNLESTPVKLNNTEAKQEGNIKDEGTKVADKNTVQKIIPVKQLEQNEEEKTSANTGEKTGGKKSLEDRVRQSSSPPKSSKLPPVCLRVDPLRKKKCINGHSRSPSPPGDRGKSHDSSGKQSEPTMSSIVKENAKQDVLAADNKAGRSKEVQQNKSKLKSIEVYEGKNIEGCGKLESASANSSNAEKLTTQMQKNSREGDEDTASNDVKEKRPEEYLEPNKATAEVRSSDAREIAEAKETLLNDAKRSRRMKLSDAEAAVVIQSAFRGFEVRKWEPLKKLKQLAKIKEQMGEIKNRIQALESSTDTSSNDKQRTIITEMIMSLLLKLDTIQGVHPSIRDIRKSVAKELVGLQETLDLLISKNLEECLQQPSSRSSEENMSKEIKEDLGTEGQNQEDNIGLECRLLTTERETERMSVESCQNQPLRVTDVVSNSKDAEILESVMANGNLDEEIRKLSGISSEMGLEPAMEIGTGDNNEEIGDSSAIEAPHDHEGKLKKIIESQQVGGETTSTIKMTESLLTNHKDTEELAELPQVTLDGYIDSEASSEHEKIEAGDSEVSESEVTKDITVVPENDEVKDLNRAELPREEGQKEQVISDLEDKLGGEEQEILNTEELGEVLPELHEIPVQVQGKENGIDAPAEFPKAETEVGPEKAPEGFESAGADSNECTRQTIEVEVSNIEESSKVLKIEEPAAAKVLGELSVVNNEMQDESYEDHSVTNANSPLGSEDSESMPAACEAPVELSKEHKAVDEKNNLEEGLEEQNIGPVAGDSELIGHHFVSVADGQEESDREESIPVSARPMEEGDIESITGNNKMVAEPCGPATAEYEELEIPSIDKSAKQGDELDFSPPFPTASQVSQVSDTLRESDRKLIEENEKLREMMEKLIEAGNKQLTTISSLSGRVKDLEKKLSRKKKLKIRLPASGSSCLKPKNCSLEERAVGLAM